MKVCDKDIFPHLHTLLRIFITLPISNASPERTFLNSKGLKTLLRSNMEEERSTGLPLLHIHRNMAVDPKEVIDIYSKKGKHRLDFVFVFCFVSVSVAALLDLGKVSALMISRLPLFLTRILGSVLVIFTTPSSSRRSHLHHPTPVRKQSRIASRMRGPDWRAVANVCVLSLGGANAEARTARSAWAALPDRAGFRRVGEGNRSAGQCERSRYTCDTGGRKTGAGGSRLSVYQPRCVLRLVKIDGRRGSVKVNFTRNLVCNLKSCVCKIRRTTSWQKIPNPPNHRFQ
nr:unnamed protein product [Callosobruchus chinensis]